MQTKILLGADPELFMRNPNTGAFVFNDYQHNTSAGTFLGTDLSAYTGIDQGKKVLDLAAKHVATGRFVCAKIVQRIFGAAAPPAVLNRAVAAWTRGIDSPDQIKQVMRAILLEGTEVSTLPPSKVRRPHEIVIAIMRTVDARVNAHPYWQYYFAPLYESPFSWPTPDGRPDTDEFWLNTATTIGLWGRLSSVMVSVYADFTFLDQMPVNVQSSPTLMTEFWVERMIGYSLPNDAMTALTAMVARMKDGYEYDRYVYNYGFGLHLATAIAATPDFMLR